MMVMRNIKSYMLLSITIVISFTILLGYLIYIDSSTYNEYKEVLASDPNICMSSDYNSIKDVQTLTNMIDENIQDAYYYTYYSSSAVFNIYNDLHVSITFLPRISVPFYRENIIETDDDFYLSAKEVKIIKGKEFSQLNSNEVIIDQALYTAFGSKELPFEMNMPVQFDNGGLADTVYYKVNVVGICEGVNDVTNHFYYNDEGNIEGVGYIYASNELIADVDRELFNSYYNIFIYSKESNKIEHYMNQLGMITYSVSSTINSVKKEILIQKQTKLIVLSVLLVVLGVNMFGSLENVISKREYEIGIKRAIGASMKSIMLQFLFESIILLLIDIMLSLFITSIIVIGYKLWIYLMNGEKWIMYLSGYSLGMYLISAIAITVVYSFILSYKASRVEIIGQLKAE